MKDVVYIMDPEYNDATFESCLEVQNPATSGPAMDLMCGNNGAEGCTPEL